MKSLLLNNNGLQNNRTVSVIVPAFNSEQTLPELVARLENVLPKVCSEFEAIFVNDCSRDRTWEVICRLAGQKQWLRGIELMRNYGQHNALLRGLRTARYEVIITLDDDLQNPPEEIPKLLDKLDEGYDVVYGTPPKQKQSFWRNTASKITRLALKSAMGAETARDASPFRAFRTQIRTAFANYRSSFVSIDVLLTWGTTSFASTEVRHDPRRIGVSNYSFRKLLYHALNMMTGFSILPLQLASLSGFGFTLFGICILAYVIGRYLVLGYSMPGFPFLASITAIFAGAQLFALGIIGEYIARMHFRSMERPYSVVREKAGFIKEETERIE